MADLTHTPAHAARLRMLDLLEEAHARTPGGLFFPGRRPDRAESHISLIEVPVADMPPPRQQSERADPRVRAALRGSLLRQPALKLALDEDALEIFSGPRGPVKAFEVVALRLRDPADGLSAVRRRFVENGGVALEKSAAMHLTLAYLKLGTKLDPQLQVALLNVAREANATSAQGHGWQQRDYTYSGRYSDREFLRLRLDD